MIKKVEKYEASDGAVFDTYEQAILHEGIISAKDELEELLATALPSYDIDRDDVFKFIEENAGALKIICSNFHPGKEDGNSDS